MLGGGGREGRVSGRFVESGSGKESERFGGRCVLLVCGRVVDGSVEVLTRTERGVN